MKKIILALFTASALVGQVALADESFTTIAEAQKYCPPLTSSSYDLIFKPNSQVDHSAGVIYGISQTNVFFTSNSNTQIMPLNWDSATGIISDAAFRDVNGIYGFISGSKITCYYSYLGWTGVNVSLILQN